MFNKTRILFIFTLFLMISALIVFGEGNNDPATNPDANACFEGGSMAGSCDNTDVNGNGVIDDGDKEWMWTCGWYLIRVEQNIFTEDALTQEGCKLPPQIIIHKEKKEEATPEPVVTKEVIAG